MDRRPRDGAHSCLWGEDPSGMLRHVPGLGAPDQFRQCPQGLPEEQVARIRRSPFGVEPDFQQYLASRVVPRAPVHGDAWHLPGEVLAAAVLQPGVPGGC